MPLFSTDSVILSCANLAAENQWWIASFECKEAKVPADWDCPLPSDVALKLPGQDEPAILLCDSAEVRSAGYERSNGHTILFCSKLSKAQDWLRRKGLDMGPIQDSDGAAYFEIRDPEGNVIEICEEP